MMYVVCFTEILERTVEIEAESKDAALDIAQDMYDRCDIVLDADDFVEMNVTVQEEKQR